MILTIDMIFVLKRDRFTYVRDDRKKCHCEELPPCHCEKRSDACPEFVEGKQSTRSLRPLINSGFAMTQGTDYVSLR